MLTSRQVKGEAVVLQILPTGFPVVFFLPNFLVGIYELWSKITDLPFKNFKNVYRKESTLVGLTYKNGFRHGTCMVRVYDKKLASFVLMGLKYIGDTQI